MLGASISSPGLARPKSRIDRSVPPGRGGKAASLPSLRLLILGDEPLLRAFLAELVCCTTAAIFLLWAAVAECAAMADDAALPLGMVGMVVNDVVLTSCCPVAAVVVVEVVAADVGAGVVTAAGGGGGGRRASTRTGLGMLGVGVLVVVLRMLFDGEGGTDTTSWKRACDVVAVYDCDGLGEIMEGVGSTRLAIEGDALARLTAWVVVGARGEPSGPVPYGSRAAIVSRTGS